MINRYILPVILFVLYFLQSCSIVVPPSSIAQYNLPNQHALYKVDSSGLKMIGLYFSGSSTPTSKNNQSNNEYHTIKPEGFKSSAISYTYSKAKKHTSYALSSKFEYGNVTYYNEKYDFSSFNFQASFSRDYYWRKLYVNIVKVSFANTFHFGNYIHVDKERERVNLILHDDVFQREIKFWPNNEAIQNITLSTAAGYIFENNSTIILSTGVGLYDSMFVNAHGYMYMFAKFDFSIKRDLFFDISIDASLDYNYSSVHLGVRYAI